TVNERTGNNILSVSEPENATISGTNISANVENDVSYLNIALSVSEGASWRLYNDIACSDENVEKTMLLTAGVNIAFVEVTAENGNKKIYVLMIVQKESDSLLGA